MPAAVHAAPAPAMTDDDGAVVLEPEVGYDTVPASDMLPATALPDPGFFEGAEKLLEMAFAPPTGGSAGLRHLRRDAWAELLRCVRCEIVSERVNDAMDAYVLRYGKPGNHAPHRCRLLMLGGGPPCIHSESSLFVFPTKVILKTCGTTTLLNAVDPLLASARACGLGEPVHVFYSRKNFLEPDRQVQPHGCFDREAQALQARFPHGKAHILGSVLDDHWCLFVAEAPAMAAAAAVARPLSIQSVADQTLEVGGCAVLAWRPRTQARSR
jgi:hypothetical protein